MLNWIKRLFNKIFKRKENSSEEGTTRYYPEPKIRKFKKEIKSCTPRGGMVSIKWWPELGKFKVVKAWNDSQQVWLRGWGVVHTSEINWEE